MRDYIIRRRAADIDSNIDGENYLAKTVHESEELINIGLLDSEGNKVMARRRMDPIGFIRHREK